MLLPNILGGIEIGIQAVPTLTAKEKRLRATIGAMLIPTPGTHLTGVSRVNSFYTDTSFLSFIEREVIQLGKGPTVQAALVVVLLALANLSCVSNVRQVLKDNRTARRSILHNALAQN